MLISLLLSASLENFGNEFVPGSAAKFEFDFRKLISIQWWLQHLSDAYAENPLHMVTESMLIIFIFYLLFRHEKPASKNQDKLTAREEEELIREWKPEPLVPEKAINKWSQTNQIHLKNGASTTVYDENNKSYIHLSSHNYLGMANHERVKQAAKETIKKYAVGSCGPRGFYGTTDIHLNLEKKLSEYFGRSSIIYPDYMGCNASVITAFAKRGDLLLIDEGCHFLITQGALLSRSNVIWYPHNDMKKLESYLQTVQEEDERHNRALNRRFIVTEGLFHNYGDICNLNDIIQLKNKYKYRLILDDSHALGVLHIKGSPGYWNVPFKNIDVYLSSMDTALGTTGAFCIGSEEITHHQTLSGSGYVFTASSPPFQCSAAQEALNIFEQNGDHLIKNLQDNAKLMRKLLFDSSNRWHLVGDRDISPLIHLQLSNIEDDVAQLYLERVARLAQEEGVLVYPNAYLPQEYGIPEKSNPKPSLRICVTQEHTKQQLTQSANIIKNILINVLSNNGQVKKSNKTKYNNDNQTKRNSKLDKKSEDTEDDDDDDNNNDNHDRHNNTNDNRDNIDNDRDN